MYFNILAFVSLLGIPIGIENSTIGLKMLAIAAAIKSTSQ